MPLCIQRLPAFGGTGFSAGDPGRAVASIRNFQQSLDADGDCGLESAFLRFRPIAAVSPFALVPRVVYPPEAAFQAAAGCHPAPYAQNSKVLLLQGLANGLLESGGAAMRLHRKEELPFSQRMLSTSCSQFLESLCRHLRNVRSGGVRQFPVPGK